MKGDKQRKLLQHQQKGQLIEEEALNDNDIVINANDETETKFDTDLRKQRSEPLTITSLPLVDKTSQENVAEWMDKSCSTSFESNEGSSMLLSTTNERSTDVSMEETDLFSLESCGAVGSQLDSGQVCPYYHVVILLLKLGSS